mmetsp:Transcript_131016/g.326878  ORF Transcript_131016/g.326878 Transcript_131016/m.326878 type:complete len:201 (-) Transcript_131016:9-611(-)
MTDKERACCRQAIQESLQPAADPMLVVPNIIQRGACSRKFPFQRVCDTALHTHAHRSIWDDPHKVTESQSNDGEEEADCQHISIQQKSCIRRCAGDGHQPCKADLRRVAEKACAAASDEERRDGEVYMIVPLPRLAIVVHTSAKHQVRAIGVVHDAVKLHVTTVHKEGPLQCPAVIQMSQLLHSIIDWQGKDRPDCAYPE